MDPCHLYCRQTKKRIFMQAYYTDTEFLNQVILPCFRGAISKALFFAILDLEGEILLSSSICTKNLTYGTGQISESSNTNTEDISVKENPVIAKQIRDIQKMVIKEERLISFIKFSGVKDLSRAYHITYFPLFKPDGKIFAILSLGKQHHFLAPKQYLDHLCSTKLKPGSSPDYELFKKLTTRQKEILYLLICGMTQTEIAQVLNIERGTVATFILRISEKLNIAGSATKILVKKAVELNLHKIIPPTLLSPRIIIID